jgi:hypothetical protein
MAAAEVWSTSGGTRAHPDAAPRIATLLFTDVEGSTPLLGALGDTFVEVIERQRAILTRAAEARRGSGYPTGCDGCIFIFGSAGDAVAAAVEAQGQRAHGATGRSTSPATRSGSRLLPPSSRAGDPTLWRFLPSRSQPDQIGIRHIKRGCKPRRPPRNTPRSRDRGRHKRCQDSKRLRASRRSLCINGAEYRSRIGSCRRSRRDSRCLGPHSTGRLCSGSCRHRSHRCRRSRASLSWWSCRSPHATVRVQTGPEPRRARQGNGVPCSRGNVGPLWTCGPPMRA